MSQEIGPVTLCHSMSLVVTLTKDCATPINEVLNELQTAEFQGGPSDSPRKYHYTRLRQKWKAPHFDLNGGLPLLPLVTQDRAESSDLLKYLIREFLTIHYHLASGKPSVVIPWSCLEEHRNRLWERVRCGLRMSRSVIPEN